ncbi:MAG: polysaccharide pyruvyl transferase CsaB [Defluviitaleaceae bacterium]|nr:polysaccharide pyruvyl transferase CsaB [Defluviitaleaceae bacterium]
MKVLHLISGGDKGGAKTSVFALLLALNEEIDVTIACFTEGVFYQEIQDMPIHSVLFKQKHRNDLRILRPLAKYVRENGYDIIHTHGARANFISMLLKLHVKVPIITTVHSDYKLDFTGNLYKKIFYTSLNAIALRTLDYYIGVSESFRSMLINRGFEGDRVFSVYNTIDFDKEIAYCQKNEFLSRFGVDGEGKTLIGIIGRFDYVKGHDIFLKAAAEILKSHDDVLFLLAGEGDLGASLKNMTNDLGISDKVIFTGFVKDIFSFINAIDINVCASRSESFPYMLLEGALMEKTTVSTAVGGIPDLIADGDNGILVPESDYHALAKGIISYINDPETAALHGKRLYCHAKAHFSRESMKRKSIEIYETVLNREIALHQRFDMMFCGYYGYANSGDDAILEAIITALRKEKEDLAMLVLSKRPQEAAKEHKVFSINRLNFFSIYKYMKKTRLFIYGGGSLIQDITSTRSLIYYTFLVHMAKFLKMRVMVYGNGIGPITKERNIPMARRALDKCDYISLRDPKSMDDIKELGVTNPNIVISVDPVFSLDIEEGSKMDEILAFEKIEHSKKYFVVNLRPWQYNETVFVDKMVNAIDYVAEKYNLTPLFVPMQKIDISIIQETLRKLSCKSLVLSKVYEARPLMSIVSKAEFAMCMRLHTLIYAASVGLPVIGLVYDPKVASFIEYMNEKSHVDTSDLDLRALKEMVDIIMENPDLAREKIARECERLKGLSGNDAKGAIRLLS